MEIKVKYLSEVEPLEVNENGDFIDLACAEEIDLQRGESTLIPLGVAMELPEGYYAEVVPRSSTFKRYGVIQTNSIGIIDHSYCGDSDEWKMPVYAVRDTFIPKGARICQFRLVKSQGKVTFKQVEHLENADRGGFGSTGA